MSNAKSTSHRKTHDNGWLIWSVILSVILVIICVASIFVIKRSVILGVSAAKDRFSDVYSSARTDTYQDFWDTAYRISEASHHVKNDVAISIGAVKEKSNLEVLKVSDAVYIVTDAKDTKSKTTSWLKVNGTGVFTVNLTAAEYLVDNSRRYILVRIPMPILDSISIDSFEPLLFNEKKWNRNNSVKNGEDLAQEQLREARQEIQNDFLKNQDYTTYAKNSAKSMIPALIKGLNPDIPDLQVEVEFY